MTKNTTAPAISSEVVVPPGVSVSEEGFAVAPGGPPPGALLHGIPSGFPEAGIYHDLSHVLIEIARGIDERL